MIHYLYAGHFVRDGKFIRFERQTPTDPDWYSPVVQKPLEQSIVEELLDARSLSAFPDEWGMCMMKPGYIVWDVFCGVGDASEFVAQLAERTQCVLAFYSSQSVLTPDGIRKLACDDD